MEAKIKEFSGPLGGNSAGALTSYAPVLLFHPCIALPGGLDLFVAETIGKIQF